MKAPPHLSPAIDSGDLLFLSGQLAFGADGKLISGNVAEQTSQTLRNISLTLSERGLSLSDVVKTTVWLTDTADFPAFNSAYAEAFGDHKPARSTVCSALMLAGALVEIEVVARRRS